MVLGAFWGTSDPAQQSFVERQMKWVAKNAIKTFGGKVKGWVDDGTIQVNVNGQQYKGSSSGSRSGRRTRLSEHEDADTLKSGGTSSGTSRRSTRNNKNKKNRAGKKKVKDEMWHIYPFFFLVSKKLVASPAAPLFTVSNGLATNSFFLLIKTAFVRCQKQTVCQSWNLPYLDGNQTPRGWEHHSSLRCWRKWQQFKHEVGALHEDHPIGLLLRRWNLNSKRT